jgi:hypothetical protein
VAAEDDAAQQLQVFERQVLELLARDELLREVEALPLLDGLLVGRGLRDRRREGEQCDEEGRVSQ